MIHPGGLKREPVWGYSSPLSSPFPPPFGNPWGWVCLLLRRPGEPRGVRVGPRKASQRPAAQAWLRAKLKRRKRAVAGQKAAWKSPREISKQRRPGPGRSPHCSPPLVGRDSSRAMGKPQHIWHNWPGWVGAGGQPCPPPPAGESSTLGPIPGCCRERRRAGDSLGVRLTSIPERDGAEVRSFSRRVAAGAQAAKRRRGFLAREGREKPRGQLRPGAAGLLQVPSPYLKTDLAQHKLQQRNPHPPPPTPLPQ